LGLSDLKGIGRQGQGHGGPGPGESRREPGAGNPGRDRINPQPTNVRQMLATLSGSATGFIVDPIPETADEAAEADEQPEDTGRESAE
jgi:hypothetical protein